MHELIRFQFSQQDADRAGVYLFTPSNGNKKMMCEICLVLTIKPPKLYC